MTNIELNLALYRKLYLIRKSEELICQHYFDDEMKTPMHMSMGGEAISVGVCHALTDDDQVYGTYRSHALYLAKTNDTDSFFAEIYGKSSSLQKGKSGSMHLAAPDYGMMGSSAVVATHIPVGVGSAYAMQYKEEDNIVVVFFGDGSIDAGVFWESLNVACLFQLPMIFVCEDNNLAVHTSKYDRQGYDSICNIVSQFKCDVSESSSTDVEYIFEIVSKAITQAREKKRPHFMRLEYYRYLEHVGISEDFDAGYRPKEEFEKWFQVDPILLQRKKMLNLGIAESDLETIEHQIDVRSETSLIRAKEADFCNQDELYKDIFEK